MKDWAFFAVVFVLFCITVLGAMYIDRGLSAVTLQTQIITPKPGIECVVVNASDSASVDCWRVNKTEQ